MFLEFNSEKIQTQIHEQQAIFILHKNTAVENETKLKDSQIEDFKSL